MYTLHEIASIINGQLHNSVHLDITRISTDTRKLISPNTSLFFAINTEKNDGHFYIESAITKGIGAVVVQKEIKQDIPYILVKDSTVALHQLVKHHRNAHQLPIVAITGSNGKTITKEWASTLLSKFFTVCKSPKSYNSQIGVPLAVWNLNEKDSLGIFEAGISKPNEMDKLEKILKPDIGVLTNIGEAHAENFKNKESILHEKLILFKNCKQLVLDHKVLEMYNLHSIGTEIFSHGSSKNANLRLLSVNQDYIKLIYQGVEYEVETKLTDPYSVQNILAAISLALVLGKTMDQILPIVGQLQPVEMRLQQANGINNNLLVFDCYDADYNSLEIAVDFLDQQGTSANKTAILSDISQPSIDKNTLYEKANNLLISRGISQLVGVGIEISNHKDQFSIPTKTFYKNTAEFLTRHAIFQHAKESILIKGAREFNFEKIVDKFVTQKHKTRLEVNLNNIASNYSYLKSKLKNNTMIMAMVKALAYGSGGYQIAKLLSFYNVDYLGVAYTDEAVSLRDSGVTTPIMVLNPDLSNLDLYEELEIEPVIFSEESLNLVKHLPLKIHLELDTGMHRLGFSRETLDSILPTLSSMNCNVISVFSHLAVADNLTMDNETENQIELFHSLSKKVDDSLGKFTLKHIANTSGALRFRSAELDMVRLGIGLYGVDPFGQNTELKPAATFKSFISQIKHVPANEGIGYGMLNASKTDRKIAIVAIGYSDGYDRRFSQGVGSFIINSKAAPVVGNVCMDMTMCDVSDIDCKTGDEVLVFGENLPVQDLAKSIDTIPYEILTNVGSRVHRVYFQE